MFKSSRTARGSMIVLIVCIICAIFIPLFVLFTLTAPHMISNDRVKTAVEGAALVAGNDLSRIVINDPNFGYVSLSNYPPVGKSTCANDGRPMPVIGINTLVGTCRQNAIIADILQNETMNRLVDNDLDALGATVDDLNSTLNKSLTAASGGRFYDLDGKSVNPLQDVYAYLQSALPPNVQLESVKLSHGWLSSGGTTGITAPAGRSAQLQAQDVHAGQYEAFTRMGLRKRSFSFAGLGSSANLVDHSAFRNADNKHISSIVKVEVTVAMKTAPYAKITCESCCQPYTNPDLEPGGAMTVRFSGRPVTGLMSWSDFLSVGNFHENKVSAYKVQGGDYGYEPDAQMAGIKQSANERTSQEFAEHLYYWLRNGHMRPSIDSVISMINEPFRSCPNEVYTYEFANNGSILRTITDGTHFPRPVAADGQVTSVTDPCLRNGLSPVIIFRDNVKFLGTVYGGKHAGQPLAGFPVTGDNLQFLHNDSEMAASFSKRDEYPRSLAVDIEIGGTGESTAMRDVALMRQRTRSRAI